MPTPTLDSLEAPLLEIDQDFEKPDKLQGFSFHKTLHNILGLHGASDFSVNLPWGEWSENLPNSVHDDWSTQPSNSVLQEAFKDVLARGAKSDTCFIDFAHLWDGKEEEFFCQGAPNTKGNASKSVPQAIADLINKVPENQPVVVRFLIGDVKMVHSNSNPLILLANKMFWDEDGNPLVTRKNARLWVGLYSPAYDLRVNPKPIQLFRDQVKPIQALAQLLSDKLALNMAPLDDLVKWISNLKDSEILGFLDNRLVSLSWNHGKILAVNGTSLLSGGANYAWSGASGKYCIIEQSCKIEGDAAVSAHAWQDYFFKYLNKAHDTDTRSFIASVDLNDINRQWIMPSQAPLSTDDPYNIGLTAKEGVKVLSTALLGDWHGSQTDLDYPVQIIQLIKDLVSSIIWAALIDIDKTLSDAIQKNRAQHLPLKGLAVIMVDMFFTEQKTLRDALGKALLRPITDPYKFLNINPNAWASRTTRLNAIANATKSVILCQQRLILPDAGEQKAITAAVNKGLTKFPGAPVWDGFIWPYDLLIAICHAIMPSNYKTKADSATVQIVLSNKEISDAADGGWGDAMDFTEFKERLKTVMRGLALLANLPTVAKEINKVLRLTGKELPLTEEQLTNLGAAARLFSKGLDFSFQNLSFSEWSTRIFTAGAVAAGWSPYDLFSEYDALVDEKVLLQRVLKDHLTDGHPIEPRKIANHCKVTCVDDAVMYIGSDNAYPSYNEEFGVWIEDQATIQEWKKKFWNTMWEKRGVPDTKLEKA